MNHLQRGAISLPRLLAALVLGLAVGWLAQHLLRNHETDAPPAADATSPAESAARAAHVELLATLRLPEDPNPVGDGKVALPAGTRFLVEVRANQAGHLTISTSRGQAAPGAKPLWSTELQANQPQLSPVMRLDGPTGLEHLHLVLRDARGQVLASRQIDIWHQ